MRGETRVLIWDAQPFSRDMFTGCTPGEVCMVPHDGDGEFIVKCGEGSLLVRESDGALGITEGEMLR